MKTKLKKELLGRRKLALEVAKKLQVRKMSRRAVAKIFRLPPAVWTVSLASIRRRVAQMSPRKQKSVIMEVRAKISASVNAPKSAAT